MTLGRQEHDADQDFAFAAPGGHDVGDLLSVIVPVRNDAANLEKCLAALRLSVGVEFEVIVVDDGSTDRTASVARRSGHQIVSLAKQGGPGEARNAGARIARGEVFVFIDADVCVTPLTLRHLADEFIRTPDAVAIFGSYDTSREAPGFISTFKNLSHHYIHQISSPEAETFWTGCGAVRRQVFLDLAGFRSDLSAFKMEDVEFGMRARRAGHRIRLCSTIQVTHLKRWTFTSLVRTDVLNRAMPWTRLMLSYRKVGKTLNLAPQQKASAAAVAGGLIGMAAGAWSGAVWPLLLAGLLFLAVVPLNAGYYRFLLRQRGFGFTLRAYPMHLVYFVYSLAGFFAGLLLHHKDHGVELWRRTVRTADALAFSLVVLIYVFVALQGKPASLLQEHSGSFYSNQAEGYRRGQLSMISTPNPRLLALPNPYDQAQRGNIPVRWDASLYGGKYYLYFSSVPIFLVHLPVRWLLGAYPTDAAVCLLFCLASLLIGLRLLGKLRRFYPGLTFLPRWAWILLLGLANVIPIAITVPGLYLVPISAAMFFSSALLSTLFDLVVRRDESRGTLVRFGTFAVLAFGCRPSLAPMAAMLVLVALFCCRANARRWLRFLGFAGAPAALGLILLAGFNYARFGSPREFGIRYQITTVDFRSYSVPASWQRNARGFRAYLFGLPRLRSAFPFVQVPHVKFIESDKTIRINPEQMVGLLAVSPLFAVMPVAALGLLVARRRRRLSEEQKAVSWYAAFSLTGGFLVLSFLITCPLATTRYQLDFLPYFTFAAIAFVGTAYRSWMPGSQTLPLRRIVVTLILLFCVQNTLLAVSIRPREFKTNFELLRGFADRAVAKLRNL